MDKIIKILFLLSILCISCSKNHSYNNDNNLKFIIERDLSIDFGKQKITVDHYGLKYEDTIVFTMSEKSKIITAFNKLDLNDRLGEFWFIDENSNTASLHDEIIVIEKNKIKSRIIINENYNINNRIFKSEEVKIVELRNLIKQIVVNKISFKKAEDSLKVFVRKKHNWIM